VVAFLVVDSEEEAVPHSNHVPLVVSCSSHSVL
jgi:hypothetical protein